MVTQEHNGEECPNCGSTERRANTFNDGVGAVTDMWWRDVYCDDCGRHLRRERPWLSPTEVNDDG